MRSYQNASKLKNTTARVLNRRKMIITEIVNLIINLFNSRFPLFADHPDIGITSILKLALFAEYRGNGIVTSCNVYYSILHINHVNMYSANIWYTNMRTTLSLHKGCSCVSYIAF